MVGQVISHYKILEKLGEGGMGVVYRAEDTKLDRPVALKFLPAHLLGNEDVRKRFEREAKSSAALSHSNVCTVFEIDEADGNTFIAMELIEGESLDKKIARGPLKLNNALTIAQQVAKGLEAAHKRGIVHRDIKPENIMVGEDGHVTIMDFGLAQLTEASRLTKTDETVGTVAYMSPEQTEGSGTDHRTDIWSLGVVLYEMITGQQPFKGDYDKAVMYSILNQEPEPMTGLRTGVPMELEFAVRKCLAKEGESRYQSCGDVAIDLGNLQRQLESNASKASFVAAAGAPSTSTAHSERRLRKALTAVSALLASALFALAYLSFWSPPEVPELPERRFSYSVDGRLDSYAISPDGRSIAYISQGAAMRVREIIVLRLDTGESQAVDRADGPIQGPFWSPDGRLVGFAEGRSLKTTDVLTRRSLVVCEMAGSLHGASWSFDGETIAYSASGDLYEVSAKGGEPRLLLEATTNQDYVSPVHLPAPASDALIYVSEPPRDNTGREAVVRLLDLGTMESKDLAAGHQAVYSRSGHLLVWDEAEKTIQGAPFSLESLELSGDKFVVAEGADRPTVADDMTLLYGRPRSERRLALWRRDGAPIRSIGLPMRRMTDPAFSPDGERIIVMGERDENPDIWVYDLGPNTMTRFTEGADAEAYPVWSPDGSKVAYLVQGGINGVYSRSAAGGGEPQYLTDDVMHLDEWVDRDTFLGHTHSNNNGDLLRMRRQPDGSFERAPLVSTASLDSFPQLSPNKRWLAFGSRISGRTELYVQPYPDPADQRIQVSSNGGSHPRWSSDGRELFFMEGDKLIALKVDTGESFGTLDRVELFASTTIITTGRYRYDASPDGQTFVVVEEVDAEEGDDLNVVQNWAASHD